MKTLVAFPSTAIFGQQAALAFAEVDALEAFFTTFAYRRSGVLGKLLSQLPGNAPKRISSELGRRSVSILADELVETRAFWEIVRTVAAKSGAGSILVDRIWDHLSKTFTHAAGRRLAATARRGPCAVYAYEYSALEAFIAAERCGAAKILDFPSLNSREFEGERKAQKAIYPELKGKDDAYFDALFEVRQLRRDTEMARADVIITNSSVTRASHIAGGADAAKTFAVPYGAPPPLELLPERPVGGPLRVVWAGTFSIRKGAHFFVSAWREFLRSADATVSVYGAVALPERLISPPPPGMIFHGSVVRSRLFEAFEAADVLIFPTLSDGFGMVVTEAFARGLPVITTERAGASDLVRNGENGLIIAAGDPKAIVEALEWCAQNRGKLVEMRSVALATAAGWQWSDYRRALRSAVSTGLAQAGYPVGILGGTGSNPNG